MKKPKWVAISKGYAATFKKIRREYSEIEAMYSLSLDVNCDKMRSLRAYSRMWSWSTGKVKRFIKKANINGTPTEQRRNTDGTDLSLILLKIQDMTEQRRNSNGTEAEHEYKEQRTKNNITTKTHIPFFDLKPAYFSDREWKELIAIRKKAKGAQTERAYRNLIPEFDKAIQAGNTADDILNAMSSGKGWAGFKHDWMEKQKSESKGRHDGFSERDYQSGASKPEDIAAFLQ